jgi:hypothetical protein
MHEELYGLRGSGAIPLNSIRRYFIYYYSDKKLIREEV